MVVAANLSYLIDAVYRRSDLYDAFFFRSWPSRGTRTASIKSSANSLTTPKSTTSMSSPPTVPRCCRPPPTTASREMVGTGISSTNVVTLEVQLLPLLLSLVTVIEHAMTPRRHSTSNADRRRRLRQDDLQQHAPLIKTNFATAPV